MLFVWKYFDVTTFSFHFSRGNTSHQGHSCQESPRGHGHAIDLLTSIFTQTGTHAEHVRLWLRIEFEFASKER